MPDNKKAKIAPAVKVAAKPVKLKSKPIRFFEKISLRPRTKLHDVRESDLPDEQS